MQIKKILKEIFMSDEYILSRESADEVLNKLFIRLRLDVNKIEDSDLKDMIKKNKSRLIEEIRMGRLTIDDTNNFEITIQTYNGGEIKFNLPGARAKRAMGDKLSTDLYGRIYAMMGACCEVGEGVIDKLDITDLSTVEVLGAIFLAK
jgi:hypothetical protein